MTKIGLIGCGMWGRNLARNLAQLDVLAAVADQNTDSSIDFASAFAVTPMAVDALINDETIDGIVIATAAPSHDALAIDGLAAGKHIYVEKPLSLTLAGARSIQDAAIAAKKQVMVGHLIRYHAAFIELQKQVAGGAIGSLRHIQANRLAMGRIRNTESVLFDLCPHDLSLILALVGTVPKKIHCAGASHMTAGVVDFLSSYLGFENGVSAGMQTSWLSPFKEHRLTVIGSAGSLVFDDTKPWPEKLTLYQDQIRLDGEHFLINRASPVALPIAEAEPLKDEMRAFIRCCETGSAAPTDIAKAMTVQQVLDTMQSSLIDMTAKP
ncbi:MAG: Gfo/Idh/MocA family oxidoreductase [Candidatus Puniceispirillum sp.]|nr:Gfo/Idh/MocA family oxidoreductase [Candidatus Puniceispirillum sp.]MBL6774005.1 Gfo/Idh/MocA family oxidoreductase [Candidatus Puniceispirillum sp.]